MNNENAERRDSDVDTSCESRVIPMCIVYQSDGCQSVDLNNFEHINYQTSVPYSDFAY